MRIAHPASQLDNAMAAISNVAQEVRNAIPDDDSDDDFDPAILGGLC